HGRPRRLAEYRSAVAVLCFEWGTAGDEEFHDLQLAVMGGEVQCGLAGVLAGVEVHAAIDQEVDDLAAAVLAGPDEAIVQLLRAYALGAVEVALHDVETADAGRGLEVQSGAMPSDQDGTLRATVSEAVLD